MSGSDSHELIQIRAVSKQNGLTASIMGVMAILCSAAMFAWLPQGFFLLAVFAASAGIVGLLIGWFKVREPVHSMLLTRQSIKYLHRHGSWQIDWDNVQRIDIPRVQSGLEQKELDLIGIKLKDYSPLLQSISPRLATNLLFQQRPLLLQEESCSNGTCYSENLIEDDSYKLPNGEQLTGIKAMLANRMTRFRERLGYDLFISAAELDRDTKAFVALLRQCHNHRLSQPDH